MNIGIFTFHAAGNYGAFLQAYSMTNKLNSFENVQADIVDYICPAIENTYKITAPLKRKGNMLKKSIIFFMRANSMSRQLKVFNESREKNLKYRFKRIEREKISEIEKKYDMFIVGSDQVWNTALTKGDKTYYLDFVKDNAKKSSYAVSFGTENPDMLTEENINLIKSFNHICVREKSAVEFLKSHVGRNDIECCVDPVYLTSRNDWEKFSEKPGFKDYILIFVMGSGNTADKMVEFGIKLAKEKNLTPYFLSDQERWYKYRSINHLTDISPEKFVGLIANAEYVITNSFHATSFAIIMHTPFYVETAIKRSGRITDILSRFNLKERGIVNGVPSGKETAIDWNNVDRLIGQECSHADDYLAGIIGHKGATE